MLNDVISDLQLFLQQTGLFRDAETRARVAESMREGCDLNDPSFLRLLAVRSGLTEEQLPLRVASSFLRLWGQPKLAGEEFEHLLRSQEAVSAIASYIGEGFLTPDRFAVQRGSRDLLWNRAALRLGWFLRKLICTEEGLVEALQVGIDEVLAGREAKYEGNYPRGSAAAVRVKQIRALLPCKPQFCMQCGQKFTPQNSAGVRCAECAQSPKTGGDQRHCLHCGKLTPRPEGLSAAQWRGWKVCAGCKKKT